jgi:hypothetical protein
MLFKKEMLTDYAICILMPLVLTIAWTPTQLPILNICVPLPEAFSGFRAPCTWQTRREEESSQLFAPFPLPSITQPTSAGDSEHILVPLPLPLGTGKMHHQACVPYYLQGVSS